MFVNVRRETSDTHPQTKRKTRELHARHIGQRIADDTGWTSSRLPLTPHVGEVERERRPSSGNESKRDMTRWQGRVKVWPQYCCRDRLRERLGRGSGSESDCERDGNQAAGARSRPRKGRIRIRAPSSASSRRRSHRGYLEQHLPFPVTKVPWAIALSPVGNPSPTKSCKRLSLRQSCRRGSRCRMPKRRLRRVLGFLTPHMHSDTHHPVKYPS